MWLQALVLLVSVSAAAASNSTAADNRSNCSSGLEWNAHLRVCKACLPGTYKTVVGSGECQQCPGGKFALNSTSSTICLDCPAEATSPNGNRSTNGTVSFIDWPYCASIRATTLNSSTLALDANRTATFTCSEAVTTSIIAQFPIYILCGLAWLGLLSRCTFAPKRRGVLEPKLEGGNATAASPPATGMQSPHIPQQMHMGPAAVQMQAYPEPATIAEDQNWQMQILPPGWQACVDPSTGRTYYQNSDTNATQWENPNNLHVLGSRFGVALDGPVSGSATPGQQVDDDDNKATGMDLAKAVAMFAYEIGLPSLSRAQYRYHEQHAWLGLFTEVNTIPSNLTHNICNARVLHISHVILLCLCTCQAVGLSSLFRASPRKARATSCSCTFLTPFCCSTSDGGNGIAPAACITTCT